MDLIVTAQHGDRYAVVGPSTDHEEAALIAREFADRCIGEDEDPPVFFLVWARDERGRFEIDRDIHFG